MKKILFFLSWVCLLSAIGVIAQSKDDQRNPLYTLSANQSDLQIQELKRVPSQPVRHDSPEGYVYSIAVNPTNPAASYYIESAKGGQRVYLGFCFEREEIKRFIGSKISHINVVTGSSPMGINSAKDVTVFITKGLGQEPFIVQQATLTEKHLKTNSIELDTQYEITDDTPLYIGYYFTYPSDTRWFMPLDNRHTDKPSNLLALCDGDDWPGESDWKNQAPVFGSLCMSVTLQGNNFPENAAEMLNISLPSTVAVGNELTYNIEFSNKGATRINDIEVQTSVGGSVYTSNINISGGEPGLCISSSVSGIRIDKSGICDVTSTITKVNGVPNTSSSNSGSGTVACYTEGYPRNIVLEEGTGTWCGWCPRGIVMFEYIRENYADRLFPIAVHQGDRMAISEYQGLINDYISEFPTVVANRTEAFRPSTDVADKLYREVIENPTYAEIELTCKAIGKTLNIASETQFSLNTDIEHQLSFVVVEDGVGPYNQSNFFTSGSGMGKWDTAGREVSTLFDDVARHIDSYPGITNSLPSTIEAGKKYSFSREINITNVKSKQFRVIAMITNTRTGEIVNASTVSVEVEDEPIPEKKSYVYSVAAEPARPTSSYLIGSIKSGQRLYAGFCFEREEIKKFIGSKISHINVTSGSSPMGINSAKDVTLFITKGLGQEPIITQKATLTEENFIVTSTKLDTPYEIMDDTPLYIGYYFTYPSNTTWFFPVDGVPTDKPSNLFVSCDGTDWPGESKWQNMASTKGSLCMSVTLQGEDFPQNIADMINISIPTTMNVGDELTYNIEFVNKGANNINDIEIQTVIGGSVHTSTISVGCVPEVRMSKNVPGIRVDKSGIYEVTSTITKVNGVPNTSSSNSGSGIVACYSEGYPRNMVLEEGTGTWCGYCPRGIVMFEYVREKYADRLFPIAVHQGDRMEISEYQKFIAEYISGFPTVVANRDETFSPSKEIADKLYREVVDNPSYANIRFTCSVDGKTLKIASETEFSLNTDIEHQLSFVVVEDGVGPYKQSNYFGQGSGMGKWDTAGSEVSTLFDDVARHIDSYPGIPNSLPSTIEAGKKYAFNREISISRVKSDQFRVIALITNTRTGEIVNASMVSISSNGNITLDKNSMTLHPEETAQLTATIHGDNAGGKTVTWSSSDENVATVDNTGLVTAVGLGKAVITASCDGKSAECKVEVSFIDAIFEVDGIRYKVTGASTCEVTKPKEGEKYPQEHFIIPKTVTYYNLAYTVTAIGKGAFSGEYCSNPKSVELPNTITELGGWAFNGWRALESIKIPNSVTTIGSCAFQGCDGLTTIELPSSVSLVMRTAFNYCSNLKEVKIYGSPEIGNNAFQHCPIESLYCETAMPPVADGNLFGNDLSIYESCTLYVPKESIDTYKTAPVWENFKNIRAIDSTDGIDEIIDEESTCDAFSLTGILVAQGKTVAELRNELPAGIYVLRFANGKTSKIIIR